MIGPAIETEAFRHTQYDWEWVEYGDLEVGLSPEMARLWTIRLKIEFDLRDISLFYISDPKEDGKLRGETSIGHAPWGDKRICLIHLYPPHHLRTLGHEICHARRWMDGTKWGHGDTWREDLAIVHGAIRRLLPKLHWCDVPPPLRPWQSTPFQGGLYGRNQN